MNKLKCIYVQFRVSISSPFNIQLKNMSLFIFKKILIGQLSFISINGIDKIKFCVNYIIQYLIKFNEIISNSYICFHFIQYNSNESNCYICFKQKQSDRIKNCCVCFDPIKEKYALVPCGHINVCKLCYKHNIKKCPTCRKDITSFIKIYE